MAKITSGPIQLDWSVYAGDSNREVFEFVGDVPVDITGWVIEAQARRKKSDPVVGATAIVTLTDPGAGRFTVEWDGEQLRALLGEAESWAGVWDLQTTVGGETLPVTRLGGMFTVLMDVTREVVA
jgi:hypothetical protein